MNSRYDNEFEELKQLGKGGFGTVFQCRNKLDQKIYAMKKIPIKEGLDGHRERALREVLALSTMDHPHVVRYFQAWIEDGCTIQASSSEEESSEASVKASATLYIQMMYCPGTLGELLETRGESDTLLDRETVWRYFQQLVEGLHHIHQSSYIHRDLWRANVFLDVNGNIRIGDFGLALFMHDVSTGEVVSEDAGHIAYMAPELKKEGEVIATDKADIFSLGLLMCDLVFQFKTELERSKFFTKLRHGDLQETTIEPMLEHLLALEPSARKSTLELRELLSLEEPPQSKNGQPTDAGLRF